MQPRGGCGAPRLAGGNKEPVSRPAIGKVTASGNARPSSRQAFAAVRRHKEFTIELVMVTRFTTDDQVQREQSAPLQGSIPLEANCNSGANMTTQVREIDETIAEALALIDRGLGDMMHRELVSTDEVSDLLLDVRTLLTTDAEHVSDN
jgi:hypothetical protein